MDEFSVLRELIDMVKELSPIIWESARRQVFISAITALIWAIAGLIAGGSALGVAKMSWRKIMEAEEQASDWLERSDRRMGWGLAFGGSIVCSIVFFSVAVGGAMDAVQRFYAPDYHAIHLLLELVR